jgi:hypothetical protein
MSCTVSESGPGPGEIQLKRNGGSQERLECDLAEAEDDLEFGEAGQVFD